MMVHPLKRQKVEETTSYKEEVLFNSDALSKIISYLPSVDLLNLALTCKRFGISNTDDELSVIKKSTNIAVHEIATEEQLAALPHYDGESSLADYHYLQLLREPLTFDQLVGPVCNLPSSVDESVMHFGSGWGTAISNNILRAGKHYVTFLPQSTNTGLMVGLMRPGQANGRARNHPLDTRFYQNFSRNMGHGEQNNENSIQCCMYDTIDGRYTPSSWKSSHNWEGTWEESHNWEGSESMSSTDEIGMQLDLDEGTLSVYKNGRKLGIMKRGLAGQYCWVASLHSGVQVSIKRGTIPQS